MATDLSKERMREKVEQQSSQMQMMKADAPQSKAPAGKCPKCGAENEPSALFCEQCGARLRESLCPFCGAPIDDGVDFCERCKQYIDKQHCSFCHGLIGEEDSFCPECGAPASGIECPVCHTVGRFGFCEACGTALTDSARQMEQEVWQEMPYQEKITQLAEELEKLWMVRPVSDEAQRQRLDHLKSLRSRVLELLAQEGETVHEDTPHTEEQALSVEDLQQQILNKQEALQSLLDSMAMAPQENPARARNYAMACKPHASRLAWKCNYKHALHTSPLGCACPQHGGKWIVLDGKTQVTDDK